MSAPAAPFCAAEFVKALTDEQKDAVLAVIVAKALAMFPESGMIPVHSADGRMLAHILTPQGSQALFEKHCPQLPAEEKAEISRWAKDPGELLTAKELLARLASADGAPGRSPPLRATG